MRHLLVVSSLLGLTLFAAACGPKVTVASPAQVAPADAADASIARGRDIFTAHCNKCHNYADPKTIDEAKWPSTVERMGKKADLNEADRDAVLHYILAARKAEAP